MLAVATSTTVDESLVVSRRFVPRVELDASLRSLTLSSSLMLRSSPWRFVVAGASAEGPARRDVEGRPPPAGSGLANSDTLVLVSCS
jgi:hypothetical protein